MEEIRSGRRPFVPLDVLHRENLKKVLSDYGVDSSSISAQEIEDLNFSWHRLDPWPDSVAGLLRLKRRFMIATALQWQHQADDGYGEKGGRSLGTQFSVRKLLELIGRPPRSTLRQSKFSVCILRRSAWSRPTMAT